jgi:hypothetical protein
MMQPFSLAWGILALLGFAVGFIPCLGWLNWFNIPFSAAGLIFSIVAYASGRPGMRTGSAWGIALCAVGVLIGAKRLILGGGIF